MEFNTEIPIVARAIHKAKRIVIVTGAGISDFRSEDGLYSVVKKQFPDVVVKGKDLFDASLFRNPRTTQLFHTFISRLKLMSDDAPHTLTHSFINNLSKCGKLLRCYTQNIDALELKAGLTTDMQNKDVKVVQLHGDLYHSICSVCKIIVPTTPEMTACYLIGKAPPCQACVDNCEARLASGKRSSAIGLLRTNIVLYNEEHAYGDLIAEFMTTDVKKKPDLLIVMGSSLKVVGVKRMIKDLAHTVHSLKAGRVVFINKTSIPMTEFKDVFDFVITEECDKALKTIAREVSLLEIQDKRKVAARVAKSTPVKVQTTIDRFVVQKLVDVSVAVETPKKEASSDSSLTDQTNVMVNSQSPSKKIRSGVVAVPGSIKDSLKVVKARTRSAARQKETVE